MLKLNYVFLSSQIHSFKFQWEDKIITLWVKKQEIDFIKSEI
jgi:hypothetical protein